MYKDKDKQREANRQASQRRRDKREGMTKQGVTTEGMTQGITGESLPDSEREFIEKAAEIFDVPTGLKRGKDIKCFENLHPDIQRTIIGLSVDDTGKVDESEKQRRTAGAIHYQHLYPDRYAPTGYAGTNPNLGSLGTANIGELV